MEPIRILLVEDSLPEATLLRAQLEREAAGPFEMTHVTHLAEAVAALRSGQFDVVLLDLNLPDSAGLDTVVRARPAAGRAAVIVFTGMDNVSVGVEAVKNGAQDSLVKGRAGAELVYRSIRYGMERKRMELEQERLVRELQEALARVRTLSGLLPICAWCKKIRDDQGYWSQVEDYVRNHSNAQFTHSICPECMRTHLSQSAPDPAAPSPPPNRPL